MFDYTGSFAVLAIVFMSGFMGLEKPGFDGVGNARQPCNRCACQCQTAWFPGSAGFLVRRPMHRNLADERYRIWEIGHNGSFSIVGKRCTPRKISFGRMLPALSGKFFLPFFAWD